MIDWLIGVIHDEIEAAGLIVLGIGAFVFTGLVGDFFSGIGNKAFGKKKEESSDSPS